MYIYYFSLVLVSFGIGIFNLSINSKGTDLTCYKITNMDKTTYDAFKLSETTPIKGVVEVNKNNVISYNVPVKGSNSYGLFATIVGLIYIIIGSISVILMLVMLWLSDMVPDDFLNISWLKKFVAVTTKIFPPLLVILSWINMFLIIAFWIILAMGQCKVSEPSKSTFGFNSLEFHRSCISLQIANSCIFVLIHCIFAIIKDMIYVEPFMYAPVVGKPNVFLDFVLKTAGP